MRPEMVFSHPRPVTDWLCNQCHSWPQPPLSIPPQTLCTRAEQTLGLSSAGIPVARCWISPVRTRRRWARLGSAHSEHALRPLRAFSLRCKQSARRRRRRGHGGEVCSDVVTSGPGRGPGALRTSETDGLSLALTLTSPGQGRAVDTSVCLLKLEDLSNLCQVGTRFCFPSAFLLQNQKFVSSKTDPNLLLLGSSGPA